MLKIAGLGVHPIQFGVKGDDERIRTLVGGFKSWLDAERDPSRFAVRDDDPEQWKRRVGIDGWPEGEKQVELLAVNFGNPLPNYAALLNEVNTDPALGDCKKGGFPHLATHFSIDKADALHEQGIPWLEVTDENSLWRDDDGSLYAPFLYCDPDYRSLNACWVGSKRGAVDWFLLCRE